MTMEDFFSKPQIVLIISILISGAVHGQTIHGQTINPFTSDGCSAFPEGTSEQKELWLNCCTAHDYAYWKGGTYSERIDADIKLHQCVTQVGEGTIALLMLAGVRVGGSPYFPTAFRWGYGWPYPRFYGALSEQELEAIKQASLRQPSRTTP